MATTRLVERAYLLVVASALGGVGVLKLLSLPAAAKAFTTPDPFLPFSLGLTVLLGGLLEIAVAVAVLFWSRQSGIVSHLLILWNALIFIFYRVGVWLYAPGQSCPCLGVPTDSGDAAKGASLLLINGLLLLMLAGSLFFITRALLPLWLSALSQVTRRRLRWAMITLLVLASVPALQVGFVAFVNPPTTLPLVLRSFQKHPSGQALPDARYQWKSLDEISTEAVLALLAAEDMEFFDHRGFDWPQIRLSLIRGMAGHQKPSGASTITQQCARSLLLWQGRSWLRKGLEAYYSVWMELLLTKRRILELYANVIKVGEGIYGLEAGACHYYGKASAELSRAEAVALASVLPAPRRRNPLTPGAEVVLRQTIIQNRIDQTQTRLLHGLRSIGMTRAEASSSSGAVDALPPETESKRDMPK